LLSSNENIPVLSRLLSTNPKYSPIVATMKINSIPVKSSTVLLSNKKGEERAEGGQPSFARELAGHRSTHGRW